MHSLILFATIAFGPGERFFDLDKSIADMHKEGKGVGLSIVVSRQGKILYAKGFGYENLKTKKPMTERSVHELASVSKQFTAAAILSLQESGKLSIDNRLSRYFPSENKNWNEITIRHLLQHTSGLPDYLENVDMAKDYSSHDLVAMIREKPLDFKPNSKWAYSNSGYMMLGLLVEKVSGMKLADYLAKRLFKPIGMENAEGNNPFSKRIVMGYSMNSGKVVEQGITSKTLSLTGDGEVMCSALDLAKWEASFNSDKFLKEPHRSFMFKPSNIPMRPDDPNSPHYAMGWIVGEANGRKIMNHSGGWMGTSTIIHRDLASKTCFIVLSNSDFDQAQRYLQPLAEHFLR